MGQRSGTLLERDVSRLFKLAGFEPQNNVVIEGYEVDIFVPIESHSIIIECKQYERSSLVVRNLIHQWDSKNRIVKASRVLLVLVGCNVTQKDNELAQKFGITIWNENWFEHLTDLALRDKEQARFEILACLKINLITPELDQICKHFESLKNSLDKKKAEAKTSEDMTSFLDTLVRDGTKEIVEALGVFKKIKNEGGDINQIRNLFSSLESSMDGISSSLYSSVFDSIEKSINDPRNEEKISKDQMKELKAFFKRTKKYLKKHNGTEDIESPEEYNHIKEDIIKLDKSGKLEGFAEVLAIIEDTIGYEDLIKAINKGYNEIEKVRNEIT